MLNITTVSAALPPGINEVSSPYPPTPFQSLIFYCNDRISMNREGTTGFEKQPPVVLIGPQVSRVNVKVHHKINAIRVDFVPGGLFRLLGIPMYELYDGGFDALDFFGPAMRLVKEKLEATTDLDKGKDIVEEFLIQQSAGLRQSLPFDQAMNILLQADGNMDIQEAASLSCLSLKQFERKCRERIGMNPKFYARILRFSKAYRLHEAFPGRSWIKIAHEAGYFDQMHMIRDFKVFAGVNPTVIEAQLRSTPFRMQKDLHL